MFYSSNNDRGVIIGMVKKKLDQVVYEHIVEKIKCGHLLEREHVTEQAVADELEISRTPVRSAFNRLVEEDYLETIENVGVRVKTRPLDSDGYQDRTNFVERLVNHYLFDLEKNEVVVDVEKLQNHLIKMKEVIGQTVTDEFDKHELDFWSDLVEYSQNRYTVQAILKALNEIFFDEGEIHEILLDSRELKLKHMSKLITYLQENDYAKARREIRILLNQLKLNVIERSHRYS